MSISVSLLFAYIRKGNVLCLQRGRSRGCNVFDRVLGLAIILFRSPLEGHGFLSVQCFLNSRMTSVIVTLGHAGSRVILAAQLSLVIFVLREEFAFLFQTFSRNDLPGEAPLSRGRSVFKKKCTTGITSSRTRANAQLRMCTVSRGH